MAHRRRLLAATRAKLGVLEDDWHDCHNHRSTGDIPPRPTAAGTNCRRRGGQDNATTLQPDSAPGS